MAVPRALDLGLHDVDGRHEPGHRAVAAADDDSQSSSRFFYDVGLGEDLFRVGIRSEVEDAVLADDVG